MRARDGGDHLMSASRVTQHFYRDPLWVRVRVPCTSKSKKEAARRRSKTWEARRQNQTAKSGFDAGVVSVVERAAAAVASGGSVHFVGHGGVGRGPHRRSRRKARAAAAATFTPTSAPRADGARWIPRSIPRSTNTGGSTRPAPGGAGRYRGEHFVDATLPKLRANDLVVQLAAGHAPCAVVMSDDLTLDDVAERFPSAGIASVRWPEVAEATAAKGVGVAVVVAPGYECAQLCPPAPEWVCASRAVWCARLAEVHVKHAIDAIVAGCGVLLGRTSHGGNADLFARSKRADARARDAGRSPSRRGAARTGLRWRSFGPCSATFDPRPGGDRVARAEVLCTRAAAAAEGAGVVPVAVLLAGEVFATAAEAREAVTEAASDGGGWGTGGGVRGVLSRYSR